MRRLGPLLLALLGLALASLEVAPPAHARDPAAAEKSVSDADKALDADLHEIAARLYREALDADSDHIRAHVGLGEALLALDEEQEAIVAFRQACRHAAGRDDLDEETEDAVRRARRHLDDLDDAGEDLTELLDDHADELVKLAYRYREKDPDLAERALDAALALMPGHERGRRLRDRLAERGTLRVALFDGRQIDDWDGGRSRWWDVRDGMIVGDATEGLATFVRTQERVEGDFDVVMEARLLDAPGETPFFALMAAWRGEYDHSTFGVIVDDLVWIEDRGKGDDERIVERPYELLEEPIDPTTWTTYELRYRGDEITAVVNGQEVETIRRGDGRASGHVGLLVQDARVAFRRVEVVRR